MKYVNEYLSVFVITCQAHILLRCLLNSIVDGNVLNYQLPYQQSQSNETACATIERQKQHIAKLQSDFEKVCLGLVFVQPTDL